MTVDGGSDHLQTSQTPQTHLRLPAGGAVRWFPRSMVFLSDYDKMFRHFRGRDPQINPMLKFYGLPLQ